MNCPPEVAEILTEILQCGLLQIRNCSWNNNAETAAKLADHIHNLPMLILDFSHERLAYYWEAERPAFLNSTDDEVVKPYLDLWERLERFVADSDRESKVLAAPK